jgi:hypothetical protein
MNSRTKGKQRIIEDDEEEGLDLIILRLNLVGNKKGRKKKCSFIFWKIVFISGDGLVK